MSTSGTHLLLFQPTQQESDAQDIASGNGASKVYIVPCQWMAKLMKFIEEPDPTASIKQSRPPGQILIGPLLERDETIESNVALSSSPSSLDDRTARRERWSKIKQAQEGNVRKGLEFGKDYTFVGDGLWTLFSNKFGFDFSLALDIEDEEIKPQDGERSTTSRRVVTVGDDVVLLPKDGRFDYDSIVYNEEEDDNYSTDNSPGSLVSFSWNTAVIASYL